MTYFTNFSASTEQIPFLDNLFFLEVVCSADSSPCSQITGSASAPPFMEETKHKEVWGSTECWVVGNSVWYRACALAPACICASLDPGTEDQSQEHLLKAGSM